MSFSLDTTNSLWMLAERSVRLVLGIVVGAYVARYLGTASFGTLTYAQSIVAIFMSIAAFGLNPIVVRSLVNADQTASVTLGAAIVANLIGCALAGAGFLVTLVVIDFSEQEAAVLLVSGLAIFISLQTTPEAALQARREYRLAAIGLIAALLAAGLLRFLLVRFEAPLIAFAYAYLAEHGLIVTAFIIGYLAMRGREAKLEVRWPAIWRMLTAAFPILLSSTVVLLYMRIDQIMIRNLIDVEAVGVYAAAIRLSEAWYFVPTMLTLSLFPSILTAKQESGAAFERRMRQLFELVAAIAWVAILASLVLAQPVILLLFGAAFEAAAAVLKILVFGGLFVSVGVASSRWYLTNGWEHRLLYRVVVGLVVNVALNLILIPAFGIAGAAWATVIGYAAGYWLFDAMVADTRPLFYSKTRSMLLIPCVISALRSRHG